MKLAVIRHNTRRILSAMLEDDESIVEILDDVSVAGDSKDPTHGSGGENIHRRGGQE